MTRFIVIAALALLPLYSRADDDSAKKMPEWTREERQSQADKMDKMADAHKKMAECLRSEKPGSECHDQMIKECPMAKDGHCPMMDGKHGHRKFGKGKMKKGAAAETEKKD